MNRNLIIIALIFLAVITRLLPPPPNFTPIAGMALFAVNRFSDKKLAFSLPIFCMILTDIFLGFHSITPFVYISIIGISCIGYFSKEINKVAILKSSILFFLISKFCATRNNILHSATINHIIYHSVHKLMMNNMSKLFIITLKRKNYSIFE